MALTLNKEMCWELEWIMNYRIVSQYSLIHSFNKYALAQQALGHVVGIQRWIRYDLCFKNLNPYKINQLNLKCKQPYFISKKVCKMKNKPLSNHHDQSTIKYYIVTYTNVQFHLIFIPTRWDRHYIHFFVVVGHEEIDLVRICNFSKLVMITRASLDWYKYCVLNFI